VSELNLAPAVGFEPTTNRLTADRSTTELRWIVFALELRAVYVAHTPLRGKLYFNPIKIDVENKSRVLIIQIARLSSGARSV
jgi:hypothetical protein